MELVTLTLGQLDTVHRSLTSDRLRFLESLPEQAADALLRFQTDQHARRSAPPHIEPDELARREANRQAVARYRQRRAGATEQE